MKGWKKFPAAIARARSGSILRAICSACAVVFMAACSMDDGAGDERPAAPEVHVISVGGETVSATDLVRVQANVLTHNAVCYVQTVYTVSWTDDEGEAQTQSGATARLSLRPAEESLYYEAVLPAQPTAEASRTGVSVAWRVEAENEYGSTDKSAEVSYQVR